MKIGERTFPLKRAIGISAVLHLLLAPFLVESPVWRGLSKVDELASSSEQIVVQSIRIDHRVHPKPHLRPPPPERSLETPVPSPVRVARKEIAAPKIAHNGVVVPNRRIVSAFQAAPVPPRNLNKASNADTEPAPLSAGTPIPTPAPTPTPEPAAAVAVAMTQKTDSGIDTSSGGWGQNFDRPILADDSALNDLRAKYRGFVVTVHVDENGRATRVSGLPESLGADARSELLARLLALRFAPAECNGLRCAGTLTIQL